MALGLAVVAGVLVGIGSGPLQAYAGSHWGRAGYGMAIAVNVLLPLATALVACWYPKVAVAGVGGVLVVMGFTAERLTEVRPEFWNWDGKFIALHTSPIQVAAAVGCAVVGSIAAALVGMVRKVGLEDAHLRCECGYLKEGLEGGVCPECGRDIKG